MKPFQYGNASGQSDLAAVAMPREIEIIPKLGRLFGHFWRVHKCDGATLGPGDEGVFSSRAEKPIYVIKACQRQGRVAALDFSACVYHRMNTPSTEHVSHPVSVMIAEDGKDTVNGRNAIQEFLQLGN
jgi:hypothetical protein